MSCDNIVDCLKANGLTPTAYASDSLSGYPASNALNYNGNQYFYTQQNYQWWEVDFKQKVLIASYFISSVCSDYWIYNWETKISNNGINYSFVDKHSNTCGSAFGLHRVVSGRYFRIICTGKSVNYASAHMAFSYVKFFSPIYSMNNSCNNKWRLNLLLILVSLICQKKIFFTLIEYLVVFLLF